MLTDYLLSFKDKWREISLQPQFICGKYTLIVAHEHTPHKLVLTRMAKCAYLFSALGLALAGYQADQHYYRCVRSHRVTELC